MSHEERLAELRKPEVRDAILAEDQPLMGDDFMDTIIGGYDKLYPLGNPPNYEPAPEDSIAARAERAGISSAAFCYDLMMENDGKGVVYFPCSATVRTISVARLPCWRKTRPSSLWRTPVLTVAYCAMPAYPHRCSATTFGTESEDTACSWRTW